MVNLIVDIKLGSNSSGEVCKGSKKEAQKLFVSNY